jgi:hypothetical protein
MSLRKLKREPVRKRQSTPEDTALLSLSPEDRARLGMDAWEPSLLRKLLTAQNRIKPGRR